jgi:uncharacterized protein YjbI with pentapeptide repeats
MKIYRPLQVGFCQRVMEQDRRFYFIASATLGLDLQTMKPQLDINYLKSTFESMAVPLWPDPGMPKPQGEVLVSGACYAPRGLAVPACEVNVIAGAVRKKVYVFGDRYWKRTGSTVRVITDPVPFKEMPLTYQNAFGGEGFDKNPLGKGFAPVKADTGEMVHPLPNLEAPSRLIGSPGDRPDPAGLGPLDPSWPQRMRFQGTYDAQYKQKYFPGYPADHDWRYFQSALEDQWNKGYFSGQDDFALANLHPELPTIQGSLPGLYPRCFLHQADCPSAPPLIELALNLDTIWFFPEKLLALLIWRKGLEVADDEATAITHALLAYEDRAQKPRGLDYYRQALDRRLNSRDGLLANLNTEDLIPDDHKCAMELLQDMAMGQKIQNEFSDNLAAKVQAVKKMADEKIEEATRKNEKNLAAVQVPDEVKAKMPPPEQTDPRQMMQNPGKPAPDPDFDALNAKMEAILPGITAGDPSKIQLKNFSFDKIGQIMTVVGEFSDKKKQDAMKMAKAEIAKLKEQGKGKLMPANPHPETPPAALASMEEALKRIEELELDAAPAMPLPRVNAEQLIAQLGQVSGKVFAATQHLQALKQSGGDPQHIANLEGQIKKALDGDNRQAEEALRKAEKNFKSGYHMGAHFMAAGSSPHAESLEAVAKRFLQAVADGQKVADGDWALIDLSGKVLDDLDLSGAFLEQVNFKGASLKGANLSGAIMARANLENADLSGANLAGANIGAVHAPRANFTGADLKKAKLSKGDFTGADFTQAELAGAESLEIVITGANFAQARMPGLRYIKVKIAGAKFPRADLTGSAFFDCTLRDTDFTGAGVTRSVFADVHFSNVSFDQADLSGASFVATDPAKASMEKTRFIGARAKQTNFMSMSMTGSDFTGADLESANFMSADLSHSKFLRANAPGAFFRKARLEGALMDQINLTQGSLAKAYLVNASLAGANLPGVDFLRATITNTDFRDCNLDGTIIEGWRPR